MTSAAKCPHSAAQMAASLPAVPCEECRSFIDRDGSLMTADIARQRYPMYRTGIDEHEARWRPAQPAPSAGRNFLGSSEQERRSNRNFLITCAGVATVIVIVVLVLVFGNNKGESQAERAASQNCPSFSTRANGECGSVQADEQAKHKEQVESEEHEAEAVIKKRAAEADANAIEGTR
jgi:hypothetical protein